MKIALINNDAFSTLHFRAALIQKLIQQKHDVTIIIPDGQEVAELRSLGARVIIVPFSRFLSFKKDFSFMCIVYKILKKGKFDLVHTMTIKPNIYGTFAARMARVPKVVCLISGAGYIFQKADSLKKKLLTPFILWLYQKALCMADRIWFQNPDDLIEFEERKLIKKGQGIVILSSGVNLDKFSSKCVSSKMIEDLKAELKIPAKKKIVLLVAARMIVSKGVEEFILAANMLHKKFPDWHFLLLAPDDNGSYDNVSQAFLDKNKSSNLTIVNTFRHDVNVFFGLSDIVTLPSVYREGVPRCLIEALSFGKPIITYDVIGCRETVRHEKNGYLIPPKDFKSFLVALESLMSNDQIRKNFGKSSRNFAKNTFSDEIVVKTILEKLYKIA